jgi:hypothetical protein
VDSDSEPARGLLVELGALNAGHLQVASVGFSDAIIAGDRLTVTIDEQQIVRLRLLAVALAPRAERSRRHIVCD